MLFGSVVRAVMILVRYYVLQEQFSDVFVTRGPRKYYVTKSSLKLRVYALIIEMISVYTQISQVYEIDYNVESKM